MRFALAIGKGSHRTALYLVLQLQHGQFPLIGLIALQDAKTRYYTLDEIVFGASCQTVKSRKLLHFCAFMATSSSILPSSWIRPATRTSSYSEPRQISLRSYTVLSLISSSRAYLPNLDIRLQPVALFEAWSERPRPTSSLSW